MVRQSAISASEGHRAFGKLLRRVYRSEEHLIVERDGFPVAVLLSYQEYERLIRQRSVADFGSLGRELGREIERQGLTEEQLRQEIEAARREEYEETYGERAS